MLSERHIAHRTDSQHKKKKKRRKTQQFRHQYEHVNTKLTAADYKFLSRYVLSCTLKDRTYTVSQKRLYIYF